MEEVGREKGGETREEESIEEQNIGWVGGRNEGGGRKTGREEGRTRGSKQG